MLIYKFFLTIVYVICFPVLYFMFKNNHFKQRHIIKNYKIDNTIWVHASSIGEVNAVTPLLLELIENNLNYSFLMTCMTKTGIDAAKKLHGKLIVLPFPFDVPHIMKKAFSVFNPKMIILVETEIWPIFINTAYNKNVPIVVVNGRISDNSFPKYRYLKLLWKPIFKKIKLVNAQSESDLLRYKFLGAPNVQNSNNLKFSTNLPTFDKIELRKAWNFAFNDFIIAIGSSRPGEEKVIIDVGRKLKSKIPRLKIIIVPRHLHRIEEVCSLLNKNEYALFSESYADRTFTIVDEMGILTQVYALSDISLIGGSFIDFGGHNPIEAAVYKKAIIIGPHHQSCADIVKKFKEKDAIIVSTVDNLYDNLLNIALDIEKRNLLGENAYNVTKDNSNSVELHYNSIQSIFESNIHGKENRSEVLET